MFTSGFECNIHSKYSGVLPRFIYAMEEMCEHQYLRTFTWEFIQLSSTELASMQTCVKLYICTPVPLGLVHFSERSNKQAKQPKWEIRKHFLKEEVVSVDSMNHFVQPPLPWEKERPVQSFLSWASQRRQHYRLWLDTRWRALSS